MNTVSDRVFIITTAMMDGRWLVGAQKAPSRPVASGQPPTSCTGGRQSSTSDPGRRKEGVGGKKIKAKDEHTSPAARHYTPDTRRACPKGCAQQVQPRVRIQANK